MGGNGPGVGAMSGSGRFFVRGGNGSTLPAGGICRQPEGTILIGGGPGRAGSFPAFPGARRRPAGFAAFR